LVLIAAGDAFAAGIPALLAELFVIFPIPANILPKILPDQ
jgi:hypothetical protein